MTVEEESVELPVPARIEPGGTGSRRKWFAAAYIVSFIKTVWIGISRVVSCLYRIKNTGVIFYLTEFLDSTPCRACIQSNSFFRIKGIMLGPVPAFINKFIFPYRGTHVRIRIATSIFQLLGIDNSNSSQKLYPIFVGIVSVITGAVHRQGIIIVSIPVKENCGSGGFQVGTAGDSLRGPFRFVQCRQKHPRKNGDDQY